METKKIAIGCFVGGVIGTAVALICAPFLWWLGMLAGFGAGYLCYDLKEIREAVPIAWKVTKKRSGRALNWLVKPHPFLLLYLMIFSLMLSAAILVVPPPARSEDFYGVVFLFILLSLVLSLVLITDLERFARTVALARKCFWESDYDMFFSWPDREDLLRGNYRQIPATYKNIYGLMVKGLMDKLVLTAKGIRIGVPALSGFLFRDMWILIPKFLWILFKLIHSQKRVLCGIDSAIGVAITYFWLGTKAVTPEQKIMVVICGGIIGAVVGALNYEIISKRLLHLVPT